MFSVQREDFPKKRGNLKKYVRESRDKEELRKVPESSIYPDNGAVVKCLKKKKKSTIFLQMEATMKGTKKKSTVDPAYGAKQVCTKKQKTSF